MSGAPILTLSVKSLLNRRFSAGLSIVAIALSVMLFTGVEKLRQGARASFEQTISGADLVVGARSSPINLMLYAVFRIGDPTNNVTWESYQEIAGRSEVAWSVPLSLGDSHRGFRVVGTTTGLFEHYRYGRGNQLRFAQGGPFVDVFDAVIGADVARALDYELGDPMVVAHGLGATSFMEHDDKPFRVAGILAPTGTPVDRSVHVSLEGIEAIHIGWESGAPSPAARAISPDQLRAVQLEPETITAFLVGLNRRIDVLNLQRAINTYDEEALLAVIPGVALSQLWEVVGVAERALKTVSFFVIVVGLVGVLTTILTSLNERRREMAILRSVGAKPRDIFTLLVSEAVFMAFVGSLLGLAALYAGLVLTAPWIEARYGVTVLVSGPGVFDALVVGGVSAAAFVLGAIPAWRAFRQALADGLTVRV